MSLIEADELKKRFIGNRYGVKAIVYQIDNAPTVKAIPIEWIEKQIEQYYDDGYNSYGKALNIMLADWRAKNETTGEN